MFGDRIFGDQLFGYSVCLPSFSRKGFVKIPRNGKSGRSTSTNSKPGVTGRQCRDTSRIDIVSYKTIVSYNSLNCNRSHPSLIGNAPLPIAHGLPMSTDETRLAILSAAEKLYAERSFGEVSLRDIVAAANVNLAAINYHFGSKDELLAELFLSRATLLNRERFEELKAAEETGGGRADVDTILRALVGPPLRWCLGADRQRSAAARFMTRASVETVPPIRKIVERDINHLRRFADALRRALPDRKDIDVYWGLHFTLAMIRQTVTDSERLRKLSGDLCDVDDVDGIVGRIVRVATYALTGKSTAGKERAKVSAAAGSKS